MNDKEEMEIAMDNLKITDSIIEKFEHDLDSLSGVDDLKKINIALAIACSYGNSKGAGNKILKIIAERMFEEIIVIEEEECEEEAEEAPEESNKALNDIIKALHAIFERDAK